MLETTDPFPTRPGAIQRLLLALVLGLTPLLLLTACGTGPANDPDAAERNRPVAPPPATRPSPATKGTPAPNEASTAGTANGNGASTSESADGRRPRVINVRTFDDMMKLKADWIDPGLANLLMAYEAGYATKAEVHDARRQIGELVNKAWKDFDRGPVPDNQVIRRQARNAEKIVDLLVREGFGFDKDDPLGHKPENLFLHRVLQRKRGYCVSLSLLALAIAHHLDINDLRPVRAPGHLFLRFGDYGAVHEYGRNFEMTDNGSDRENRHYIRKYSIHPQAIAHGTFLRNLDNRKVFSDVTSNLGSLFYLQGKYEESIAWYERAADLDPDNSQAHYNLATALVKTDDAAGAIAHFRKAIAVNPGDYHSLCGRGRLYFEMGDPAIGLQDINNAISLQPGDPYARVLRGVLRAKSGESEQAEQDFLDALQLDDNHVQATRNLALLYAKAGKNEKAAGMIRRFLQIAPNDPDASALREHLERLEEGS